MELSQQIANLADRYFMYSGKVSRVNLGKAKDLRENMAYFFDVAKEQFQRITYIDESLDNEVHHDIYSNAHSVLKTSREIIINLGLEYRVRERRQFLRFNEGDLGFLKKEVKGTELEEHVSKVTLDSDHVSVHKFSLKLFEYIAKEESPIEYVSVFLNRYGIKKNGSLSLFTYDVFDSDLITKLTTMVDKLREPALKPDVTTL